MPKTVARRLPPRLLRWRAPTSDNEVGITWPALAGGVGVGTASALVCGGTGAPETDKPRNFIAASTDFSERGPNRRISRATMRARRVGTKTRPALCPDEANQLAACSSAAAARRRNSWLLRGSGSTAATWRYSHADSFSWYQLSRGRLSNLPARRTRPRPLPRRGRRHLRPRLPSRRPLLLRLHPRPGTPTTPRVPG